MDTQALVELEEAGWRALSDGTGAQFYDAFMADEGMMAIPFGLMEHDDCVEAIAERLPGIATSCLTCESWC